MALFSKQYLTGGSGDGMPTKVVATATPGTLIHTVPVSVKDEIWLFAQNTTTADVLLTIEWGDATAPDHNIIVTVPFKQGLVCVVPGLLLSPGLTVRAFAASANVVTLAGYVNRIT